MTGLTAIKNPDQQNQARTRRQDLHELIGELCTRALNYSGSTRFDDERLIKRWKDELFAVIEPRESPIQFYEPDHEGHLDHYRQLFVCLQRRDNAGTPMVSASPRRDSSPLTLFETCVFADRSGSSVAEEKSTETQAQYAVDRRLAAHGCWNEG